MKNFNSQNKNNSDVSFTPERKISGLAGRSRGISKNILSEGYPRKRIFGDKRGDRKRLTIFSPYMEIASHGAQIWEDHEGRLHRNNDKPAVITRKGTRYWFKEGILHRDNGPAVIYGNRRGREYWKHGKRHNDKDEPAVFIQTPTVTISKYYKNGLLHRDTPLMTLEPQAPALTIENKLYYMDYDDSIMVSHKLRHTFNPDFPVIRKEYRIKGKLHCEHAPALQFCTLAHQLSINKKWYCSVHYQNFDEEYRDLYGQKRNNYLYVSEWFIDGRPGKIETKNNEIFHVYKNTIEVKDLTTKEPLKEKTERT